MGCHTWYFRPIDKGESPVEHCAYSIEEFGDNRYTDEGTPHNLFRVDDYPEDFLLSLDDTIRFIEQNKVHSFAENWEDRLKKFWLDNPEGVIEFG